MQGPAKLRVPVASFQDWLAVAPLVAPPMMAVGVCIPVASKELWNVQGFAAFY